MSPPPPREPAQPKDQDQNIRRLSLVAFLLSRPGRPVSVAEIREKVEGYASMTDTAFKRRFYEDRAELAELGVQIEAAGGDEAADLYSLRGDAYYLPKVELTGEEITALAACLAVLEDRFAYSQPLRLALLSLAQGRPELLADAEQPPLTIDAGDDAAPPVLPKLQAAVADRKTVTFTYYAITSDTEMERTVDPYGLQFVGGEWYLIGRCHLRDALRTFRLSRIRSRVVHATRSPHDFDVPSGFDIATYRDRPQWRLGAVSGSASVRVSPAMAWWVEAHWGHCGTVETLDDGGIVYTTGYADAQQLLSWVLGLAEDAELLEPPELRERLRAQLHAVEAAFDAPAPEGPPGGAGAPPRSTAPGRARRRRGAHDDLRVEVDRFTRLTALASYLLTSCGEDEVTLAVDDICRDLGVSKQDLKADVRLLNVVNFGGDGGVLFAEFTGSRLHVWCDLAGPALSRPARLSPLQADTLLLAIGLVGGRLPISTGSALHSAAEKIRAARWDTAHAVEGNDLLPPDEAVLDKVNAAITGRRLLRIEYWKEGTGDVSTRTVEPYLLVHSRGEWYYVCWCRTAQGTRVFRVATTRAAELLDETFDPRDEVEVEIYRREGIPSSGAYAPRTATLWYSKDVTRWVEERQPVRRLADGSCLAEQPYVDAGWLTHFVLRFADQARVLAPPEAAAHLRATVSRLLALYG